MLLALAISLGYWQWWLTWIKAKTVLCTVNNDRRHMESEIEAIQVLKIEPDWEHLRSARTTGRLIPRKIHQTYRYSPMAHADEFPDVAALQRGWKTRGEAAGWEYTFWNDTAAREYLGAHFSGEVVAAYDAVVPPAFKADLFRYCVLYRDGGIYADIDVQLIGKIDEIWDDTVSFAIPAQTPAERKRDPDSIECGAWNGLTASAPGHPYLRLAIRQATLHINRRWKGDDIKPVDCWEYTYDRHLFNHLYLTGPNLIGASISRLAYRQTCVAFIPGEYEFDGIPGKTMFFNRYDRKFWASHGTTDDDMLFYAVETKDTHKARAKAGNHYDALWKKGSIYVDDSPLT